VEQLTLDGLLPDAQQLQSSDPANWSVAAGWRPLVDDFFASPTGQALQAFLAQRLQDGAVVFPPEPLKALALTKPESVRVVILGQDPYHGRGQAQGLAFSVAPGVPLPPSLRHVFQELRRDLGLQLPASKPPNGSLVHWAKHGVLLLNTCLTVEEGRPASHAGQGWEVLTDALIAQVSAGPVPVVFLLWGAHAQAKRSLIDASRHLILTANHPSPLSALRAPEPFLACAHFSKAQSWLRAQGVHDFDWRQIVAVA
jgi:uracil-DNA glycosylase